MSQVAQQKALLGSYIRTSQNGQQIKKASGSRNQVGIGGHMNSQVSNTKNHRSINSGNQMLTVGSASGNYTNKTVTGLTSKQQNQQMTQQSHPANNSNSASTHKIIDEVVLRLSQ